MAEPLARAALVPEIEDKYLIVADLIKLRPATTIDSYYLLSFINFSDFRKEADRLSTGTTRTRISLSTLKNIDLPKPPIKIQSRIAEILRTVDQAIEKTEALIEKYQQIKAGLMHDLFTRGIGPDGKLRPPPRTSPGAVSGNADWVDAEGVDSEAAKRDFGGHWRIFADRAIWQPASCV
jgi:type I restriction enzyme S subunit